MGSNPSLGVGLLPLSKKKGKGENSQFSDKNYLKNSSNKKIKEIVKLEEERKRPNFINIFLKEEVVSK